MLTKASPNVIPGDIPQGWVVVGSQSTSHTGRWWAPRDQLSLKGFSPLSLVAHIIITLFLLVQDILMIHSSIEIPGGFASLSHEISEKKAAPLSNLFWDLA